MPETQINPITGDPIGNVALIDAKTNLPLNPITGEALGSYVGSSNLTMGGSNPNNIAESISGSQLTTNRSRGQDISRYTDYGVPLGQNLDWDEIRARNQSTFEQWGRGLAKAGVTTLGAVAENTLGVVAGLGELFTGGAYYDNAVGQTVDKTNAWMQEYMPNYRTQEEQDMSAFQKMGTANFWGETVAGGLGYSIGSIATMWLTGGVGMVTKGISAGAKALGAYNASKAIINGTALGNRLSKGVGLANRLKTAANALEVGAMMSLAEASVESRETQRSTYNSLVDKWLSENIGFTKNDIPTDMLKDFEEVSYAAGNSNFAIQMPVLMGTNLFMFGKQVAGFKGVSKVNKDVIFDAASRKAANTLAERGIVASSLSRLKPLAKNGLTETFQESMQFGSGAFSSTYHTDKYNNGGYGDMSKALTEAGKAMLSPEGLESALVGFLTGAIMGGGQSIVGKEYSNRKEQAQMLTDIINGGVFESTQRSTQNANASAAALSRMEKHLENGNIKKFKDEQFKLIQYQALEAINKGGLQVMLEKLEDSKGLSETEFMKQYGYPTEDAQGNFLSLKDSGDKSQDAIIEGFKKKLLNFQKVHDTVNSNFPLADKTRGLPRLLMSEEERTAEDRVYNKQNNLRNNLIFYGSEVKDRTRRMDEIVKSMQKDLNENASSQDLSFATSNNPRTNKNLKQAVKDQYETTEEVETSEYDSKTQYAETTDRFNKIIENLYKTDPVGAEEFKKKAQDYLDLMGDNNVGIDSYNKLASNEYVQEQMQQEIEAAEAAAKQNRADKNISEAIKKAKTAKEFEDLDLDNASPEIAAEGKKKLKEFRDAKAAEYRKYMEEKPSETKQQQLARLKEIDKKDLTPIEIEGLNEAIEVLTNETSKEVKEEVEPTEEDFKKENEEEVQKAFEKDNTSGITDVSEDGRSFLIEGEEYFNDETNPLDAIRRTKRGKIKGIRLTKKRNGQVDVIWEKDKIDVLSYIIMNTEQSKIDSEQGIPIEEILESVEVIKEEVDLELISKQPHGAKTSESINVEIHDLSLSLSAVLESVDTLRTYYIQEAEATKEDLKNDEELKLLNRKIKSLKIQIAQRKRILTLRGETIIPSSEQELKAERKILDTISNKETESKDLTNTANNLASEIEQYKSDAARYKTEDDFESFKQVNENILASEKLLSEILEKIKKLNNSASYHKSKLNKFKNEQEENNIDENGEQVESDPTERVEGQNDGRESEDTGEVVEEEEASVEEINQRREEEIANYYNSEVDGSSVVNPEHNDVTSQIAESWLMGKDKAFAIKYYEALMKLDMSHKERHDKMSKWMKSKNMNMRTPLTYNENEIDRIDAKYDAEIAALKEVSENSRESFTNEEEETRKAIQITKNSNENNNTEQQTTPGAPVQEGFIMGLPEGMTEENMRGPAVEESPTQEGFIRPAAPEEEEEVNKGIENTDNTELEVKAANTDKVVKIGNKYRVLVDSSENPVMYPADTLDGNIIKINQDLLLDPNIKNEVVTLEIIANDYYKGLGDETSESWKNIPIYYKIGNEYVGKLAVSDSLDRKYIVDQLVLGNLVTTKVSKIMSGARNMNHTTDKNNERVFLHPEVTFGKNEVILAVVNKSPMKQGIITGPVDPFLDQGDLEVIQGALSTQPIDNIGSGQVVAVIRPKNNPQGDPRITPLLTENLNEAHAMLVMDLLAKGEYDKVKEIIATSAELSDSDKFIRIDNYPDGSSSITYKSEATGGLIRIKDFYLQKALRGESYKFDDVKFKNGNVLKYKADRGEGAIDIKKDLTNFIKGKKYNVDNDLINLAADYTSPLTGEIYTSTASEPFGYQQYLFSDTELSGEKTILSTDLVKIGESMFNNPEVTFDKVSVTDTEGVSVVNKNNVITPVVINKVDNNIQFEDIPEDEIDFDENPNDCN